MSYNPVAFWKERNVPSTGIDDMIRGYFLKHTKDAETVLDFGVGTGRLLPLWEGKDVTGFDIVERDLGIPVLTDFEDLNGLKRFDVGVVCKVFLHIPPDQIDRVMNTLLSYCKKVVVCDTQQAMNAEHCFNHDFKKYGKMHDVFDVPPQLYFYYKGH